MLASVCDKLANIFTFFFVTTMTMSLAVLISEAISQQLSRYDRRSEQLHYVRHELGRLYSIFADAYARVYPSFNTAK